MVCSKHKDKLTAEHNKEDAYVKTGFNNWKKAPGCFNDHQGTSSCFENAAM